MFYCEPCRARNQWTKGIRGFPTSIGNCEMCHLTSECYDVPSAQLDLDSFKAVKREGIRCSGCQGTGRTVQYGLAPHDPHHGYAFPCESCNGTGSLEKHSRDKAMPACDDHGRVDACGVDQCQRRAMVGRSICEHHAFPAARPKSTTGRRAAVEATRRKLAAEAQVSEDPAEE